MIMPFVTIKQIILTYFEPLDKLKIESAFTGIAGDGNPSKGGISTLFLTGCSIGVARQMFEYFSIWYLLLDFSSGHLADDAKTFLGIKLLRFVSGQAISIANY